MKMKRFIKLPLAAQKALLLAILIALVTFGYLSINAMNAGKPAVQLETFLDSMIPFNHHWVWAYYLYFPFIFLPFIFLRTTSELIKAFVFYLITATITLTIFALWRTVMVRPEILANDLSARLLRGIYEQDHPYNCFPSQHVAYSWTATIVAFRSKRSFGLLAVVIATLITLSTLFVKQHWFVDVPGGFAVVIIAYFITYNIILKGQDYEHSSDTAQSNRD